MTWSEVGEECQYCKRGSRLAPPLQLAFVGQMLHDVWLELNEKEDAGHAEHNSGLICTSPGAHARTDTSL